MYDPMVRPRVKQVSDASKRTEKQNLTKKEKKKNLNKYLFLSILYSVIVISQIINESNQCNKITVKNEKKKKTMGGLCDFYRLFLLAVGLPCLLI